MGVGALSILVVGIGLVAARASIGETLEPLPGVYSKVPGGWTLAEGSNEHGVIPNDTDSTFLVPEGYEQVETLEAPAAIGLLKGTEGTMCEPQPSEVITDSPSPIKSGYNDLVMGQGNMASGSGTVAGHKATWNLNYSSSAVPWRLSNSSPDSYAAAEHPNYSGGVFLNLCVEELDLVVEYGVNSDLFEESSEDPDNPPTAKRNALVPEAREEVHLELRRRYEEDIESLMGFLREMETDGWDGRTDLDEIPTSLEDYDDALEDPFQGKLKESSSKGTAPNKSPSNAAPPKGANTQPPKAQKGSASAQQESTEKTAPALALDPAVDEILPALRARTTAPLVVPAQLPDVLKNVAVNPDATGDEYEIGFFRKAPEFPVQKISRAETFGTLRATPESEATSNEYFEATSEETVELPDGTEATLRRMSPVNNKGTQGPYWEGKLDKQGMTYTLTITSEEIPKDAVTEVLSNMVPIPEDGSSGKSHTIPKNDAPSTKEKPSPKQ